MDDDSQLHIQLLSPKGDNDDSTTTTTNNVNNDVDLQFKVIVLGNRKVGKRTLLSYLNQLSPVYGSNNMSSCVGSGVGGNNASISQSLSIDYSQLTFVINKEKVITLKIWSSNGMEANNSLTKNYYNNTNIVLLMYDVTNANTFNTFKKAWRDIKNSFDATTKFIVVGNKNDCINYKDVSVDKAVAFAKANAIEDAVEISAKNGNGIEMLFEKVVNVVYKQYLAFRKIVSGGDGGGVNTSVGVGNTVDDSSIEISQEIGEEYIKEINKLNKKKCCYLC
jgi:small GTP-binding protein